MQRTLPRGLVLCTAVARDMIASVNWSLRSEFPGGLGGGEVHIWPVGLFSSQGALEEFLSLLCPEERNRAGRFQFEHLTRAFALSRGSLRLLLGHYLRCPPGEVTFHYGANGKPALPGSPPLHFNSSHSGALALFGFSLDYELGVDVEQIRPMPDLLAIASRYFSPPEMADLESLPEEARLDAFFRCWTRKEAYIKATGEGLSAGLDTFRVTVLPEEPPRITQLAQGAPQTGFWSLHHLDLAPGYTGALVHAGEPKAVRMHDLVDAEGLLTLPS